MKKLLKIRFVKFEKALAMQILQQVGKFKDGKRVKIGYTPVLAEDCLCLRGRESEQDNSLSCIDFSTNDERDKYLEKVVRWISAEQFNATRNLEVGKACMVSLFDDLKTEDWVMGRLLAILPKHIRRRYIIQSKTDKGFATSWTYARPVSVSPKIDGDVYTWKMEVAE